MAYDETLARRVRVIIKRRKGVTEKKMFGGLAFLINGNMCCGVNDKRLMLRLGNDGASEALQHKHAQLMDFTGRPLKSMVYINPEGLRTDPQLRRWIDEAVAFARTLPNKDK